MKKIFLLNDHQLFPEVDESHFVFEKNSPELNIDINANTEKVKVFSLKKVQRFYELTGLDFSTALMLHIAIIICYFASLFFSRNVSLSQDVVEVNFGMTEAPVQTRMRSESHAAVGETEATKTKEELPQLTKNALPDTPQEKFQITEHKKFKLEKIEKPEQKIKIDDFLKRKEMDLRKEDKIKSNGVHNKDLSKPNGQKKVLDKIPTSPFESKSNIPANPFSKVPTGVLSGKVSASSYNDYRSYLGRQLKLNWNASEGNNFPVGIKTKLRFTINQYGYLVGVQIVGSSGNKSFDDVALNSLKRTFPVSEPPPADINPPQTFEANYDSSSGIQ